MAGITHTEAEARWLEYVAEHSRHGHPLADKASWIAGWTWRNSHGY